MKKIAIVLSTALLLVFTGCSGDSSKKEGDDQVKDPVMNSGSNTEGERATDAVSDSAKAGSDSTVHRDKDALSSPH